MGIGLSFSDFPIAFVPLSASCLPPCLAVARYAFDKSDSQSVRQQNEIALDSNDQLGIKFVNKEITPFAVFSCSSRCLRDAISMSILNKTAFRFKVPTGVINRFSSYWGCLQVYGVVQAVSGILTWCVMTRHSASCLDESAERIIGLTSVISTSSHKPSNVCSANCPAGSSRNCCLTLHIGL